MMQTTMTPTTTPTTTPTSGAHTLTIHISFHVDHFQAWWSCPGPAEHPGNWANQGRKCRAETYPALLETVDREIAAGPLGERPRPRWCHRLRRYEFLSWLAAQWRHHTLRVVIEPVVIEPGGAQVSPVPTQEQRAEHPHWGRPPVSDRVH
jgi:hypothetical protein